MSERVLDVFRPPLPILISVVRRNIMKSDHEINLLFIVLMARVNGWKIKRRLSNLRRVIYWNHRFTRKYEISSI